MKKYFTIALIIATLFSNAQVQPLKISANKRFFQTKDDKPFFWMGDTGWLLFKKCKREEAIEYLDTRQKQGFNVIQVMLLHELSVTDAYGDSALINQDVSRPNVSGVYNSAVQGEYDYWKNVDFVIDEAAKREIYIALVPVWGGNIKYVTVTQAKKYATFLADRYKDKTNIIWLNGGDIKGSDHFEVWNMIGNTLRSIDKNHLIGFHPRGRNSSSAWFNNERWLDFNMFQSGHRNYSQDTSANEKLHYGEDNWRYVNDDYKLKPTRPTLDGEPSYENIPQGLHNPKEKRWTAADVRRYAYWSVFAGGAGFTYGNNSVMQFYSTGNKDASYGANKNWEDELNVPGASQMHYLKELMLGKNYFDRMPAQELVIDNGDRYNRVAATKGNDYAMFYVYNARDFKVAISKLKFKPTSAMWFSPEDSQISPIKEFAYSAIKTFTPPGEKGNGHDWVLILEK